MLNIYSYHLSIKHKLTIKLMGASIIRKQREATPSHGQYVRKGYWNWNVSFCATTTTATVPVSRQSEFGLNVSFHLVRFSISVTRELVRG